MQEPSLDDSKNFSTLQPGSSVATALHDGESKRMHVVLLEVMAEVLLCMQGRSLHASKSQHPAGLQRGGVTTP